MVLNLLAHIVTGILIAAFVVYVLVLITDAAWKSVQRRRLTREAAEGLLKSWSQLADAQREAMPGQPKRATHLRSVPPPKEK
jgi:hypothetical protein